MMRSVLAVLAGILVLSLTSFAIEWLTEPWLLRMFPTGGAPGAFAWSWPKLVMAAYTTLCIAAGGYVAAWLAGRAEVKHAVIMGVIQLALNAWAMVEFRDKSPLWSWIVGLVVTVPAAWCGGILYAKSSATRRHPEPAGTPPR